MKALLVSGYAGEPDAQGRRKPLTAEQREQAEHAVHEALVWLDEATIKVLIEGDAPGVDTIAKCIALVHYAMPILPMPAQWKRHGRCAGTLRNEAMLQVLRQLRDCGYECRVLCLPGPKSRGTKHMERIAREAEFDVTVEELP